MCSLLVNIEDAVSIRALPRPIEIGQRCMTCVELHWDFNAFSHAILHLCLPVLLWAAQRLLVLLELCSFTILLLLFY